MFDALKKYAVIEGRANRKEFWLFYLFVVLIATPVVIIEDVYLGEDSILALLLSFFFVIPAITVGVRRLHDFDKSGWWYLTTFIPLIGLLILLFIGCIAGSSGKNRFGPKPKN